MASLNESTSIYSEILNRLHKLRMKLKLADLLFGILFWCASALLLSFLLISIEAIFRMGITERALGSGFLVLGLAMIFAMYIIYPSYSLLFKKHYPDDNTLASRVGSKFSHLKDKLINALQVFKKHDQNLEGYSLELIDESILGISDAVREINFNDVVEYKSVKRQLRFVGLFLSSWIVLGAFFFSTYRAAGHRLLHPLTEFKNEVRLKFSIIPGNVEVLKGEKLKLSAEIEGEEYFEEAVLILKNLTNHNRIERQLIAASSGEFIYTIESVKDSFEYSFRVLDQVSPEYRISVLELPMVRNLQIKLTYPKYTKIPSRFMDQNVGDIAALKGTQIEANITTNKPLKNAWVIFDDSSKIRMKTLAAEARITWALKRIGSYFFKLIDKQGNENQNPIFYRMDIVEDNHPTVKLIVPGMDVDLDEDMRLFLVAEAQDDFGFLSARLNYRIYKPSLQMLADSQSMEIKLPSIGQESITIEYDWDLSQIGLLPSDYASYHIEVFDNDYVSGPKSARSLTYTVRFPSMFEMYSELNKQQEETFEDIEDVYDKSKDLKEKLDEIVEEIKKDPKLNWEERKNIEDALELQKQVQEDLEKIDKKLDDIIERIEKNDLVALETLKKYKELQELFNELASPELKKVMQELQKALENMDPKELQKAVQKFNLSQEDFLKSIERTLSMLKRLKIEQELDESIKKAEELANQQEELNKQSKNTSRERSDELADKQAELQKDAETLQKEIDELKREMEDFPDMPLDKMQATSDIMREQQVIENMQKASQMFQSGNMKSGNMQGQNIKNSLMELAEALKSTKQQMNASQKKEVMQALQRSTRDLLNLSKEQEALMGKGDGLHQNSSKYNELAEKQQNLMTGLGQTAENLMKLSQKTFFVTPEIGKAIGRSFNNMKQALKSLEDRRGSNASKSQGLAMMSLNEAVKQMRNSMQNLAGASSAMGMEQFMNQLQAIAGRQQGINQQTLRLNQSGRLTLEQQAAMARLAAEQEALRKSLEQLQREMGNRSEIPGRLDEVANDMGEVVKELSDNKVNQKIIRRQQRILSRLLDAQRSMRRQDFSRKRKAETAKKYLPRINVRLPGDLGERKKKLQEDLLQALKEGYSRDYKELIKKYFEALAREAYNDEQKTN